MSVSNQLDQAPQDTAEEQPEDFYIDILSGDLVKSPSDRLAKKLLLQKVLKRLIEGYGFNRDDIEVGYRPRIVGSGNRVIDIGIFEPGQPHDNENIRRIVVCEKQAIRNKLRSLDEARSDCEKLIRLMELFPHATLGIWPIPGEATSDLEKTGGVIQVSADAEGIEDALARCFLYLSSNQNVGLGDKAGFQQLTLLLFAKLFDETRPVSERQFWIKGNEPFIQEGQQAIQQRIKSCIKGATSWQPEVLEQGWMLTLRPNQTARIVMELARYSLSETQPKYRTTAFRAVARSVMDGREGRYPTPLNVAEMAVQMLDPKPDERIMDCASGTGTFLAMTATHIYKQYLADLGTAPEEAGSEQFLQAQAKTAAWWATTNALGCDIDPFLAVTSRMNLLFTTGDPGRIFRIDARTFPDGDLDGIEAAQTAMPLGSMDVVLLNPWFSTKDTVSDTSILEHYDLGNHWERDEDGGFRNTGNLNTGGVPPEVLFLERGLQWVKPGTGRMGILLPDGLLGNPGDEYIRWWILRHCEVLASVDLPIEPFKVTVKEYSLTPALPSLLILRRRSQEELINTEHPGYKVFMAVVNRAGVDARNNLLFQRAPDGEELIFEEEVIERVRESGTVKIRRTTRRSRRIHDELPLVAEKYKQFRATGEVAL